MICAFIRVAARPPKSLFTPLKGRDKALFHSGKIVRKATKPPPPPITKTVTKSQKKSVAARCSNRTKRQKATLASETVAAEAAAKPIPSAFSMHQISRRFNNMLNQPRTVPVPRWISPRHYTMTYADCFGHSSFLLVAISYSVDDFLQLRIIATAGSAAMLFFTYFHPHGRVLWLPFKWNLLFIAINSYRVGRIYLDRYFASNIAPEYKRIHDSHFYVMDPVDFARLVRLGTAETFQKGEKLVIQGEDNKYVRLVISGELNIMRDDNVTYQLHEGNFVSEAGLHAGLLLRGRVESCCTIMANADDTVVLRWNRTKLMHLLDIDQSIRRSLKAILSWDIVSKLKSQRVILSSGLIQDPEGWTKLRREQGFHRYAAILHNMLQHPQYLKKRKEELQKYRQIHFIDDGHHEEALKEVGWTLAEFKAGSKEGVMDEQDEVEEGVTETGWLWFIRDFRLRFLG
jgi:CRP-like cAMP-binding protein